MIALVIVSHCHDIAEGTCRLAAEMTQEPVPIVAVGGIIDEHGQFQIGTDALRIVEAIQACWRPAGVLLLVDVGSAVLSAETAIELLPEEQAAVCLISNAPLVEGAIVAALEASLGHTLEEVNRAAETARRLDKVFR